MHRTFYDQGDAHLSQHCRLSDLTVFSYFKEWLERSDKKVPARMLVWNRHMEKGSQCHAHSCTPQETDTL